VFRCEAADDGKVIGTVPHLDVIASAGHPNTTNPRSDIRRSFVEDLT
jgi:hypothetical protein